MANGPQRFEFTGGGSNKFWEVRVADKTLHVRFGRIGTDGQSQQKIFADAALAAAKKLISEQGEFGHWAALAWRARGHNEPSTPLSVSTRLPTLAEVASAPCVQPRGTRGQPGRSKARIDQALTPRLFLTR